MKTASTKKKLAEIEEVSTAYLSDYEIEDDNLNTMTKSRYNGAIRMLIMRLVLERNVPTTQVMGLVFFRLWIGLYKG